MTWIWDLDLGLGIGLGLDNKWEVFQEFCYIMQDATREDDDEIGYKETFRYYK